MGIENIDKILAEYGIRLEPKNASDETKRECITTNNDDNGAESYRPIESLLTAISAANIDSDYIVQKNGQWTSIYALGLLTEERDFGKMIRLFMSRGMILPYMFEIKLSIMERRKIIADATYHYLCSIGKFIVNENDDGIFYFCDGFVLSIENEKFVEKIPPAVLDEIKIDNIISRIRFNRKQYPVITIYRDFFYDEKKPALYISDRLAGYWMITPLTIEHFRNSENEIYFEYVFNSYEFLNPDFDEPLDLREYLASYNYDLTLGLKKQDLVDLLYGILLSCFFADGIYGKPVIFINGPQGSGKTSLARLLIRLLISLQADVQRVSLDKRRAEEEVLTILTNQKVAIFDNLERPPSSIEDLLAVASTGGQYARRKLYTTNTMIKYRMDAITFITAMNPRNWRSDILDRMIIIPLNRLESFSDDDICADLMKVKKMHAKIFYDLRKMMQIIFEIEPTRNVRMASFYRYLKAALTVIGADADKIITRIQDAITQYSEEQNELLEFIIDVIEGNIDAPEGANLSEYTSSNARFPERASGKELLDFFHLFGMATHMNTRKLISEIRKLEPMLKKHGILFKREIGKGNKRLYSIIRQNKSDPNDVLIQEIIDEK